MKLTRWVLTLQQGPTDGDLAEGMLDGEWNEIATIRGPIDLADLDGRLSGSIGIPNRVMTMPPLKIQRVVAFGAVTIEGRVLEPNQKVRVSSDGPILWD
jgi:hypothetical protein